MCVEAFILYSVPLLFRCNSEFYFIIFAFAFHVNYFGRNVSLFCFFLSFFFFFLSAVIYVWELFFSHFILLLNISFHFIVHFLRGSDIEVVSTKRACFHHFSLQSGHFFGQRDDTRLWYACLILERRIYEY
jgi:hypothetical protein